MGDQRKVREILARYVRATDARDGAAQGALFTEDAVVEILVKSGPGSHDPLGAPLIGGEGVRYATENFMPAHPQGGSSHHVTADHVTADHIIDVDGDRAHLNAQYVVFETRAHARPADGWPEGALGARRSFGARRSVPGA